MQDVPPNDNPQLKERLGAEALRVTRLWRPYLFDGRVGRQFIGLPLGLGEHDGFPVATAVNLDHVRKYSRTLGPVAGDGKMLRQDQ